LKALDAPGFAEKFKGITGIDVVDDSIYKYSVEILTHRNGSSGEDLYLIDGKTGGLIYAQKESVGALSVDYNRDMEDAIKKAHKEDVSIIALHNHPNSMPPSLDDGSSAKSHGYALGVTVGHNLNVHTYTPTNGIYSTEDCRLFHNITLANKDRQII